MTHSLAGPRNAHNVERPAWFREKNVLGSRTCPTRRSVYRFRTPPCAREFAMSLAASIRRAPLLSGAVLAVWMGWGWTGAGEARAESFLDPAGPIASAQVTHLKIILILMAIVVIPVFAATPWLIRRYRYGRSKGEYRPDWSFATVFEILAWGVPILVVLMLAVYLWQRTHTLDPYNPVAGKAGKPLVVDVVAYDWKWLFLYPEEGVASVGELAFPASRPLELHLTSDTVMQSFMIPRLGSQIYAMKGMQTKLHLAADGPGTFEGRNTQFNGEGFYTQNFKASAMNDEVFARWVKAAKARGLPLDNKARAALEEKSNKVELARALDQPTEQPILFSTAPSGMFDEIAGLKETQQ